MYNITPRSFANSSRKLGEHFQYFDTSADTYLSIPTQCQAHVVRRSSSEVYGVCHQNKQRILLGEVRTYTSNTAKSFVYLDDALHILVKATSVCPTMVSFYITVSGDRETCAPDLSIYSYNFVHTSLVLKMNTFVHPAGKSLDQGT